jgi:hypothetical protein
MKVSELIEKLNAIEDKELKVIIDTEKGDILAEIENVSVITVSAEENLKLCIIADY